MRWVPTRENKGAAVPGVGTLRRDRPDDLTSGGGTEVIDRAASW